MAKAAKRLPQPKGFPINERHSVSIEKIANGYLVHESHDGPKRYSSKTTYSKGKPAVTMPKAAERK